MLSTQYPLSSVLEALPVLNSPHTEIRVINNPKRQRMLTDLVSVDIDAINKSVDWNLPQQLMHGRYCLGHNPNDLLLESMMVWEICHGCWDIIPVKELVKILDFFTPAGEVRSLDALHIFVAHSRIYHYSAGNDDFVLFNPSRIRMPKAFK